jgi:hypothetical protein
MSRSFSLVYVSFSMVNLICGCTELNSTGVFSNVCVVHLVNSMLAT